MDSIARRFFAGFTAFVFLVWSVVFPVTVHAATYNSASNLTGRIWYVPAQGTGLAGSPVVATAATMLGRANPWLAAITLGTPIMQYLLEKRSGGNFQISARDAPISVTEWGGVNPPANDSLRYRSWVIFNAASGSAHIEYFYTAAYQTPSQICALGGLGFGGGNICTGGSPIVEYGRAGQDGSTVFSCADGYTKVGSSCNLTSPSLVKFPSDGVPTYVPKTDGSGFELHSRDPDKGQVNDTSEFTNPQNNYSTDPFGNPASTSFVPQTGGGMKLDQRVQTTNNNQTTTTINNITINNAGQVTNIYTTTVPGSLDLANPGSSPVTSGSGSIQFPTDYNRESTQQSIQQKLEDLKQGTGASDAPNYASDIEAQKQAMKDAIKEMMDALPGQYSTDKSNWFSWVWTPPVGNCSPWTSTIHGQFVSWDICPYVEKVRDVIGFLLAISGAWLVYTEMFRRDES